MKIPHIWTSERCDRTAVLHRHRAIPLVFLAALIFLSGCTLIPVEKDRRVEPARGSLGGDYPKIKSQLYAQYTSWKSVSFKNGGLSKNGVDCSGFVYLTFLERFEITLPRSTTGQAETGFGIPQRDLRAGDLVFFKTGFYAKHVGIYLEKRTFLHVSQQRGVSIGSLDNTYWKKRYWQARRI